MPISQLVPHFLDPRVGAIAGNAKVGNRVNLWTRWQALEYITSQNFERRALNTWMRSAWFPERSARGGPRPCARPAAITRHRCRRCRPHHGFARSRAIASNYEDRALAYTEAPTTANGLMRQRFRWSFGILQAVWKHQRRLRTQRRAGLGRAAQHRDLPDLLPLVSPFIDMMFVVGDGLVSSSTSTSIRNPPTRPTSSKLVVYFALFMVIDFVASTIAFALERRQPGGKRDCLAARPRLAAALRLSAVVFARAHQDSEARHRRRSFAWDKLERTATVKPPAERRESVKVQ